MSVLLRVFTNHVRAAGSQGHRVTGSEGGIILPVHVASERFRLSGFRQAAASEADSCGSVLNVSLSSLITESAGECAGEGQLVKLPVILLAEPQRSDQSLAANCSTAPAALINSPKSQQGSSPTPSSASAL